ncbi:MAG: hypothetical protein JW993_07615 [Sedimentisphaerales bacterium]|nr:hypothetical protein [Sedimentisphaerales bacterium]
MKELTILIPFGVPAASIGAALIVVAVATLKSLTASYARPTAVVLAIGVTIMALAGAAPVILIPSPARESSQTGLANGSALMLLPFLTLAISRLLCDLLTAAGSRTAERGPRAAVPETTDEMTVASPAQQTENVVMAAKPRGRPKRQQPKEGPRDKQGEHGRAKQEPIPAVAATLPEQ